MEWLNKRRQRKIERLKAELTIIADAGFYNNYWLVRKLELKIQIAKLELKVKK